MKQKIRTLCNKCGKSKYFKLIKKNKNSFYKCTSCGNIINTTENLKKNKKIILSIFIIFLFFLTSCKHKEIVNQTYTITFRLKPDQKVNFAIELNDTLIEEGILESTWNDKVFPQRYGTYKIYYWNKDYYIDILEYIGYNMNRNHTVTKQLSLKPGNKKGNVSITLLDKIIETNQEQNITIQLKSNDTVKKIIYCIYYTTGFIYVQPLKDIALCESYWTNKTIYGNFSHNTYFCDKVVRQCSKANWDGCYGSQIPIPENIKADNCYFLGKTLENKEINITLKLKTMPYYNNNYDSLQIYVYDMELSKDNRILGQTWGYRTNNLVNQVVIS